MTGPAVEPRTVTLFVPCYVDYLRPQAGVAAVRLLESLGHEVSVQDAAVCCGQPLTNAGCRRQGDDATSAWYRAMPQNGTVVVLSSSCTVHLGEHRPPDANVQVLEICEFLAERHRQRISGRLASTMCLHASCHGLRALGANRAAQQLLGRIDGLQVMQTRRPDECCGFGGSFSTTFSKLSIAMGRDRLAEIEAVGAEELVATDISCLLHLQGIARARRRPLHIRHIVEVLDAAMHHEVGP